MTGNVLYMRFNNDSSVGENDTHVYDFSGMGNNGTVYAGAHYNLTNKKFGSAAFERCPGRFLPTIVSARTQQDVHEGKT